MTDRTERIQIQVSALAEFGQALAALSRLQQQGLDPATRSSARFSEEFERITEVAQQVGSALRQTQAFAEGLGDTSATTALRFQRLSESLNASQNALRGVENEYAASQVRLVQLNASLGDLQTRQQQANAALQGAERGSEAYERHRRAVQELEGELRRLISEINEETQAQNRLERQANDLAEEINQVNEALRTQAAQMQDASEQARRLAQEQDRLNDAQTSFSGVMGSVSTGLKTVAELLSQGSNLARQFGVAMLAGVTAPIIGLGVLSTKTAATYDSLMRGLAAVSGGQKQAEAQFKALRETAKMPGLGLREVIQGVTGMQAAGISFDQAEKSIRAFGNALATVGKGREDLKGVLLALTQMKSKGVVQAEEVNQQLGERVPQLLRVMKDAFGTSDTQELQKRGVTSAEFIKKITDELLKLPQASGGAQNAFENLADEIEIALLPLGQAILPPLIELIENYLTPAIQTASQWFASLSPVAQKFSLVIGLVASAIGPIALIVAGIAGGLAGVISVLGTVASAVAAVGLPGIIAAVAGFAVLIGEWIAVIGAFAYAWQYNWGNVRTITMEAVNAVRSFVMERVGALISWWKQNGDAIEAAVKIVVLGILELWRGLMNFLAPFIANYWNFIKNTIVNAGKIIGNAIMLIVNILRGEWGAAWTNAKTILATIASQIGNIVVTLGTHVVNAVIVMVNGVIDHLNNLLRYVGVTLPRIKLIGEESMKAGVSGSAEMPFVAPDIDPGGRIADALKPKEKTKKESKGGGGGGGEKASEFARFLESAKLVQTINDETLADMKQSADDAVKVNGDLIEREKAQTEAARAAGLIGADEYYRTLANLAETQAQMDVARVEEEIRIEREREQQTLAALEALAAKRAELASRGIRESADDAKARAEAERDLNAKLGEGKLRLRGLTTDLEIAQRKRQDAVVEGQRKVNQGLRDEQKALDELEQQYFDLTASESEKRRAAVYKEADAQLDKIRPGLSGGVSATGDDPEAQKKLLESLDELERQRYDTILKTRAQKLAQIEFDERLAAIAEIQNRLKEQEANLDREALKLSYSQYEVEARKKAMREGAAVAIEKEVAAMRALVAANPSINNQQNQQSIAGAQRSIDDLRFNMSSLDQELRQNLTQSFEGFFKNLMTGAQGAAEAFRAFVGSVLGGISQMIAKLLALWVVQKLVGFVVGAFGGGLGAFSPHGAAGGGLGGAEHGIGALGLAPREKGGDVLEGMPYLVGEKRPEVFVPGAKGWIYPSIADFARSLMPRGIGGNMPMPQAANFKGGGNTTNEYLFATLFDKKSLQSLIKSKPMANTIVNIVSDNIDTILKARGL